MACVADRFVETTNGEVVDLATGERVWLTVTSAGGESEQRRWTIRCDLFQKLHHPAIAMLVDYGLVGEGQRFEAWHCCEPWQGSEAAAAEISRAAISFLQACQLTIDGTQAPPVHRVGPRPIFVPSCGSGYPNTLPVDAHNTVLSIEHCGVLCVHRSSIGAVAELLDSHDSVPIVVDICGVPGSGKTTMVRQLARAARLQGYVPISIRLLDSPLAEALRGRSALIIDDDGPAGTRSLVDVAIRWPGRHVLLTTSREATRRCAIVLSRLQSDVLAAAVLPAVLAETPAVRHAAERSGGVPGTFIELLHGKQAARREPSPSASRAAEGTPAYGDDGGRPRSASSAVRTTWPAPGELVSLRRCMAAALAQLRAGRHAPGDRALRQAIGGLARRGIWTGAAEGALALAASLLKRGRPRDAIDALDRAREYSKRSGEASAMLSVGTLSGVALIDLGRLDDARSVLGAAACGLEAGDDLNIALQVELARARCRFWRAEYADARDALAHFRESDLPEESLIRLLAMRARVAVGCGDLADAVAAAVEALRRAELTRDAGLIAGAACSAALAHLAVGDLPSLEADAATCRSASHLSRDPLCTFRVQLMLAEQFRRLGRRTDGIEAIRRVTRVPAVSLPPLLRRRREMLVDLLIAGTPLPAVIARHVARSGLPGLALYLPRERQSAAEPRLPALWDDAIETLRLCQDASDERGTLTTVCGHVQRQLRAAAVTFFGVEQGALVRLAGNGGRLEPAIAERAISAALPIAPHRIEDRVEAGAPVRYGGATIGAIAVRWALGSSPDPDRAIAAMTVATTAAGPIVATLLASRQRAEQAQPSALIGVGHAMMDVRRSVDRAGAAPFPVLIEGESGSGKELVAREIHRSGPRRDRPFCTLNCAALPDDLVESELFGHARGAFTGAVGERIGVFEEAHGGTLFLDEVGELSPRAQAKVLRVIQEGELRRIGENTSRRIDVRVVSATNRDLRQEVALGRFRLDLLYRLDVIRIVVPPLRERREDIPLLVEKLWHQAAERVGCRATLGAATIAALAEYDWAGNVRELQNVLAALAVRASKRGVIPPAALPPQFGNRLRPESYHLDDARRLFEERFVRAALARNGGRRTVAASELGLTRQGLTKLMNRLGLV
jgi:DNA-binding NtrC family response regulator/tetratricopeptide (TPR) repeat protein